MNNMLQELFKIIAPILEGKSIQLEFMEKKHWYGLQIAADHEEIWRYMPYQATKNDFNAWFEDSLHKMELGTQITYVARKRSSKNIIGATSYYDVQLEHKRITLGYSWYTPEVWGSTVNAESKLLMLEQAFEVLKVNRVEIGTDSRNTRSYRAIKKLGAKEEGVLRQHMILHGNVITDTILFSILSTEWPNIKMKLNHFIHSDANK